jgi:hypothetical protein
MEVALRLKRKYEGQLDSITRGEKACGGSVIADYIRKEACSRTKLIFIHVLAQLNLSGEEDTSLLQLRDCSQCIKFMETRNDGEALTVEKTLDK